MRLTPRGRAVEAVWGTADGRRINAIAPPVFTGLYEVIGRVPEPTPTVNDEEEEFDEG
jgi:hypothetical protein